MLVIYRFRAGEDDTGFRAGLESARQLLARQTGFVEGSVGRNLDDPTLWVLCTRWENVGSYRRALSSYEVKTGAVPVLSQAADEPSAYEVVDDAAGAAPNTPLPRRTG